MTVRTSAAMLSRSAIDIPRGPYMPIRLSSPRYGYPASATVGVSAAIPTRLRLVTAKILRLPA